MIGIVAFPGVFDRKMATTLFRLAASTVSVVGFFLLGRVVFHAGSGALAAELFGGSAPWWPWSLVALGLGLPAPLHVISIGLIVQRRWLSPPWARAAWIAIVTSGCWLGLALLIRLLLLP